MPKSITAIVKKISRDSWAKTKSHSDQFVMENQIGHRIQLTTHPEHKGWYLGEDGFNYHPSWLKEIEKQ